MPKGQKGVVSMPLGYTSGKLRTIVLYDEVSKGILKVDSPIFI